MVARESAEAWLCQQFKSEFIENSALATTLVVEDMSNNVGARSLDKSLQRVISLSEYAKQSGTIFLETNMF